MDYSQTVECDIPRWLQMCIVCVLWSGNAKVKPYVGSQFAALLTQACPTMFYIPLFQSGVEVRSDQVACWHECVMKTILNILVFYVLVMKWSLWDYLIGPHIHVLTDVTHMLLGLPPLFLQTVTDQRLDSGTEQQLLHFVNKKKITMETIGVGSDHKESIFDGEKSIPLVPPLPL